MRIFLLDFGTRWISYRSLVITKMVNPSTKYDDEE
jgi:hypothetical protein